MNQIGDILSELEKEGRQIALSSKEKDVMTRQ